ncbi:MAG: hypothetical protein ACKVHU_01890 [Acidimicrobiales bacterium]|jgi:hypothetical protein
MFTKVITGTGIALIAALSFGGSASASESSWPVAADVIGASAEVDLADGFRVVAHPRDRITDLRRDRVTDVRPDRPADVRPDVEPTVREILRHRCRLAGLEWEQCVRLYLASQD